VLLSGLEQALHRPRFGKAVAGIAELAITSISRPARQQRRASSRPRLTNALPVSGFADATALENAPVQIKQTQIFLMNSR